MIIVHNIRGYEKAYYDKKGQEVQQEVCKVWKDIKKANKTVSKLSVATEKQLSEWKQIEVRKRGSLLSRGWGGVGSESVIFDGGKSLLPRHVAMGVRGGATAPPNVFLAPPREIWEVFVIVDRREFTSTS